MKNQMKAQSSATENPRIYVVVAEKVNTLTRGKVVQVPGRQIAQACHAVRGIENSRVLRQVEAGVFPAFIEPGEITTVILSARDDLELYHLRGLLAKNKVEHYSFFDTNQSVYGDGAVFSALATQPVVPSKIEGILNHLPLWGAQ